MTEQNDEKLREIADWLCETADSWERTLATEPYASGSAAYDGAREHGRSQVAWYRAASSTVLKLLSDKAALEAERDVAKQEAREAISLMSEYAREAGEAKGRLEMSEAAGIVDGWRERAEAAEAERDGLRAALEELADELDHAALDRQKWADHPGIGGNKPQLASHLRGKRYGYSHAAQLLRSRLAALKETSDAG